MTEFKPLKKTLTHTTLIEASKEAVFPLLCPVREYDWIWDWKCDVLLTDSGLNELHCVFQTEWEQVGSETWFTVDLVPDERVAFVRAGADWMIHYIITLRQTDSGTSVEWKQILVGITPKGNENVEGMTLIFDDIMEHLGKALSHFLKHGMCLMEKTR